MINKIIYIYKYNINGNLKIFNFYSIYFVLIGDETLNNFNYNVFSSITINKYKFYLYKYGIGCYIHKCNNFKYCIDDYSSDIIIQPVSNELNLIIFISFFSI